MSAKKLKRITDAVCIVLIFAYILYLRACWGDLPERVPIHFNLQGIPDRYGKKGSLLFEPILGILILALMMFCECIPKEWCNFPVEVTEENQNRLYEIGQKMLAVIKLLAVMVCLYAGLSGNLSPAPMWPVIVLIAGIFVVVIAGIRAMKKYDKTE